MVRMESSETTAAVDVHPLDPLTAAEITTTAAALRDADVL
jgi:Cu2+-containing amine oxidase